MNGTDTPLTSRAGSRKFRALAVVVASLAAIALALVPLVVRAQSSCANTPAYTPCEMVFELSAQEAAAHPNPYYALGHKLWGMGWWFVVLALINSAIGVGLATTNSASRVMYTMVLLYSGYMIIHWYQGYISSVTQLDPLQ